MQMSRVSFFAFVEGITVDDHVHGTNCDRALSPMGIEYRLSPADELPGSGGGKSRLRSYFCHLAERNQLVTTFKGKTTVVVFFMDKDIDDQLGTLIDSPHVLYTWFYDVENHVFHEGDIAEAVSSSCSLPPNWCREEFGKRGSWQESTARNWIDWVRLCFTTQLLKIPGAANYGRPSAINPTPHLPADSGLATRLAEKLQSEALRIGISSARWAEAASIVDSQYSNGLWDKVFKGKWYGAILKSQVLAKCPNKIDSRALASSLVRHVATTMTFDSAWSMATQQRIQELAASHGLQVESGA